MSLPELPAQEDAILAALTAALTEADQDDPYAKVALYDGELDESALRRTAARCPLVLVAYAGCQPLEKVSWDTWSVEFRWTVVVIAKSYRGSGKARRDPYGTSRMITDVRTALFGRIIVAGLEPFDWPDEAVEIQGAELSAYSLTFGAVGEVQAEPQGQSDQVLERIGLGFDHDSDGQTDITGLAELKE